MHRALEELSVYARHVLALFWPNAKAPVLTADLNEPADVSEWTGEELQILIDEGRRQIDRQHDDLERIRTRAQVLIAFGLALEGSLASFYSEVLSASSGWVWPIWALAMCCGAWSILGAAATSVVRADMEMIHAAVLTRKKNPMLDLAEGYGAMMKAGQNELATRLTNFRHAVAWLLICAALGLASWLLII